MLDRAIDSVWPTSQRPAPALDSAGSGVVILDRGVAAAIDLAICYGLVELPAIFLYSLVSPASYEALGPAAAPLSLGFLLPLWLTYAFGFEWRFGRTPGKVNRGLLVVHRDGTPCGRRASAVRNLLRYVDVLGVPPLVLGLVVALAGDGRRVGDYLAGTVVVRARAGDRADQPGVAGSDVD